MKGVDDDTCTRGPQRLELMAGPAAAAPRNAWAERPVTPGARRLDLHELERLADVLIAEPDAIVAVSDVHGDLPKLQEVLTRLGCIDDAGRRTGRGRLLQIGDLVDGRDERDYDTLEWGSGRFDVLLAGNHEAALMGGGSFDGQPGMTPPEIAEILRRNTSPYDLRMHAAFEHRGVLFTHAGVHPAYFTQSEPSKAARAVNEAWEMFLARASQQPDALFGAPSLRGGVAEHGGVLWQDWRQLLTAPRAPYRQVVGHTKLGGPESDSAGRVHCIDTGGSRLGISVLTGDAQLRFGSDVV